MKEATFKHTLPFTNPLPYVEEGLQAQMDSLDREIKQEHTFWFKSLLCWGPKHNVIRNYFAQDKGKTPFGKWLKANRLVIKDFSNP